MGWKSVLGTVAPWIGMALGGPLGGLAVDAAANALGLSEKTEGAIKQALAGVTSEQMLALKNADHEFSLRMQELGVKSVYELEKLSADDRDSARKREMSVLDRTPRNLAYAITVGFFATLATMIFVDIPPDRANVLYMMLGALGSAWAGVIAYYFGSSSGSNKKTELLAKAGITN